MTPLSTSDVMLTVQALTGIGTLAFMIFTAWRVGKVATKLDATHELTSELVIHTNSLTDKLMQKTDVLAEARGVEIGIAQQRSSAPVTDITTAAAEAAAKVLAVAAQQAADTLALAVKGVGQK